MLKPVSTTTPTFDGKNEKIELFEDFFQPMLKIEPEMTKHWKSITFMHIYERKDYKHSETKVHQTKKLLMTY